MIITICGSTKFKDEMLAVAKDLTIQNYIVLMPHVFHHADNDDLSPEQLIVLENLHYQKINMSDAIFVVNVDGYIGESTFAEIDWAQRQKKEVYFLVNPNPEEEKTEEAPVAETVTDETPIVEA